MSFLIHSVSESDYPALQKLATKYTLLNLPSKEELLKAKIQSSIWSFNSKSPNEKQLFMFTLKDSKENIIGASQVVAKIGLQDNPRYSMCIIRGKETFLQLKINHDGPSFVGAVVLEKSYRGHPDQLGKQLVFILFLFMAMNPNYFEDTIHGEVEPWLDENRSNPFFNYFVHQKLHYSPKEADYLSLTDKEKIFASFPRKKFLLSGLPKDVQKSIGQPGEYSKRALSLLQRQNFQIIDEVDPFDGGPFLEAKTKDIPIVKHAKQVLLVKTNNISEKKKYLWGKSYSTQNNQFIGGMIEGKQVADKLLVSENECAKLSLYLGEKIWVSYW